LLGGIAAIVLIWAAYGLDSPPKLNIVLLISGGLIGWVVGILITPSGSEKAKFSEFGTALSTFVTGYLVAKLDKLFDLSTQDAANVNAMAVGRVLLFASGFALGALFTFIWRAYVVTATVAPTVAP
jgi:hypothetical protein